MPNQACTYDPARPLAIMHIPKTGGTGLTRAIAGLLRPRKHVSGWDLSLFGAYRDFASWPPQARAAIFFVADQAPLGADLVSNHLARSTLARRYPQAQRLTVLREPRCRLLSHWIFWRACSGDLLLTVGSYSRRVLTARRPLAEFLGARSIASQIDNVATRMLLWPHPLVPVDDFIDERHDEALVAEASEHLRRFDFVDIHENPGLADNLSAWLGRAVEMPRENVTQPVASAYAANLRQEISGRADALIRQRCRLDDRLWQAVAARVFGPEQVEALRKRVQSAEEAKFAALLLGDAADALRPAA